MNRNKVVPDMFKGGSEFSPADRSDICSSKRALGGYDPSRESGSTSSAENPRDKQEYVVRTEGISMRSQMFIEIVYPKPSTAKEVPNYLGIYRHLNSFFL
jgi:hypothetical protein